MRSVVVLHDRREMLMGKELAVYLTSTPPHHFAYSSTESADLSQFLTQNINRILRSGYDSNPTQLLTGDAAAGKAYFNGAGKCQGCHSVTGDLAGIGKKYAPAVLQQRFLFPASVIGPKLKTQVTVVTNGKHTTGELIRADDFTVALRNSTGEIKSFNRSPGVVVTVTDPYEGHTKLVQQYTDADIHNLTTYLDTLQ